jgi:hypothetical protein
MLAELVPFDPRPSVRRIGHHTEFPAAGEQRLDAYAPVGLQRDEPSEVDSSRQRRLDARRIHQKFGGELVGFALVPHVAGLGIPMQDQMSQPL